MLHHHTTDPAQRAADIADCEAEKIWDQTHDFNQWLKAWHEIYSETLREFQPESVLT